MIKQCFWVQFRVGSPKQQMLAVDSWLVFASTKLSTKFAVLLSTLSQFVYHQRTSKKKKFAVFFFPHVFFVLLFFFQIAKNVHLIVPFVFQKEKKKETSISLKIYYNFILITLLGAPFFWTSFISGK